MCAVGHRGKASWSASFCPYALARHRVSHSAAKGFDLARAEMRIAVRSLLRRLPDIRLAGDVSVAGLTGGKLMAIISVPVEFTPSSS